MYTFSQPLPDIYSREKHPYGHAYLQTCAEGGEEYLDPISVEQGMPWSVCTEGGVSLLELHGGRGHRWR